MVGNGFLLTIEPVGSRVSVSMPSRIVAVYVLGKGRKYSRNRVESPVAVMSRPEANGSRIPSTPKPRPFKFSKLRTAERVVGPADLSMR